ncbi:MAG: Zn-dependent protease [Flavobacterium sp.]
MKKCIAILVLLVLNLSFVNCSQNKKDKTIVLQPLGDFSSDEAKAILQKIAVVNPQTVLRKSIPFPKQSYNKLRNRYRADSLLTFLKHQIGEDEVIVGLSYKDISTTKGNHQDWGVMGLGNCPGNACVVSSFRLSKKKKSEQFYKVILHELGHTQGLRHCLTKTCYMRDAQGGNLVDYEKEFCKSCKKHLKEENWKLV